MRRIKIVAVKTSVQMKKILNLSKLATDRNVRKSSPKLNSLKLTRTVYSVQCTVYAGVERRLYSDV